MPRLQRLGDAPDAAHVAASRSTPPGRTACRWPRRSPRPRSRSASPAPPGRRSPRRSRPSSASASDQHRGREVVRAQRRAQALAADDDAWRPARPRRCTWRSIFSTARALIIGPICEPASRRRPDLQRADARGQLLDEAVVHARLHEHAVRADAGLAAVAELGGHQAVDRRVEVGVVEHDERRVAAEFERQLLQRVGRLRAPGACPPAWSR